MAFGGGEKYGSMEMKTEIFLEKKRVREIVFAFCGRWTGPILK